MDSGAVIYVPSFIKIGSGIQKLMGGGIYRHTHRQQRDLISLHYFFQNKESRLKMTLLLFVPNVPHFSLMMGYVEYYELALEREPLF
jgi:hypothetical protein